MTHILLKKGLVLTLDGSYRLLKDYDVLIEGDKIVAIDKDLQKVSIHKDISKVIDAKDKLIMPGLVNAHFHSYDAFMKGLFEDLPLEIWVLYMDLSLQRPLTENELYIRTLLVTSEMIRNGITTMHDNVTLAPLEEKSINAVMNAYNESGVRAYVGLTVKNQPDHQSPPRPLGGNSTIHPSEIAASLAVSTSETVDLLHSSVSHWNGRNGRLWISMAPSAPQRCTDDFLLTLDALSAKFQIPISTHVLETKVQVLAGLNLYGKSIVKHLKDLGFLSNRLSIHHGVWLNDQDIEFLAEKNVSVIHNPVANLRLRSGIAPIRKMLNAGVNVALGCDNMTDNDSQNIFEAMKFAALLPEVEAPAISAWSPAEEALKMATYGGARSVLSEDRISSIEVGKQADIILLDLNTQSFSPLNSIVRQLVYCESGRSVDTVIIAGRVIMENKQIQSFDEQSVLEEARAIGKSRRDDWEMSAQAVSQLREYVERIYWLSVYQDIGINRYTSKVKES